MYLDSIVSFVHELEEFVDDRLQKAPMSAQKSRILSHDVHNIRGNNGFVIFALLLFAKTQQLFDDRHQKPFLVFFVHGARYAADGPAQSVQILPRPFRSIHLIKQKIFFLNFNCIHIN